MAGAMVANAEYDANGKLTDKGKLYVKAAELVVETIHGYDKGVLLGASLDLATGPDGYMNTYGADFGFRDHIQTAMSSIGNGIVDVGNIVGEYTRNIQEAVTVVKNGIKEINARYTTIDFTKLHERTKDSTVFDRAYEGAAKPFVHLYKGAQHIITGVSEATQKLFENLEPDGDAEPDERETYLTDESPDSEAPSISDIVHNFYTWLAGDSGNGDGEPEVDLSALSEEDQDAVKAFDQIIKAEVDDALIIEVPLPPIGEELDQAAIDKARLSNTKKLGQILLRASERYHEFAEENPTIAEYGLTVASGVVQTLLGGPVGTANFVRGQATGAVMGALTAEAREQAITSLAGEMKGLAPELSVEESRALAAATIIIPEGAATGTAGIKSVLTHIKVKKANTGHSTSSTHVDPAAKQNAKIMHDNGLSDHGLKHHVYLDAKLLKKEINMPDDFNNPKLQKKFEKHNKHFGMEGMNYNKQNAEIYKQRIIDHVKNDDTLAIAGTHRGTEKVVHYFNPKTEVNVMKDTNGNWISGWRLEERQIKSLKVNGNIQ